MQSVFDVGRCECGALACDVTPRRRRRVVTAQLESSRAQTVVSRAARVTVELRCKLVRCGLWTLPSFRQKNGILSQSFSAADEPNAIVSFGEGGAAGPTPGEEHLA